MWGTQAIRHPSNPHKTGVPPRPKGRGFLPGDRMNGPTWEELEALLESMQKLQSSKVAELACRLKPGLTAEDIRNPHDFPELNDPDWHYEDGILTGIESVISAVRSQRRGA
jgi:hypothetical protein